MDILIEQHGVRSVVDESLLIKTEGVIDDEREYTTWVKYRFPDSDTFVHESCHVTLKQPSDAMSGQIQHFG